ncbi:MAG TPA: pyridoxamine 5'-phosphate oxidase family protein [Thermodesulfobacteriota bacterium]|nr:pyridoxamine 5'-phosphate oxidase family protein [Thermodesulfobacteriota bacterium]
MVSQISTVHQLKALFETEKLAVLATQEEKGPYLSLMAFAFTDDLRCLLIATKRSTRKYSNMVKNPSVSLLIDNRLNQEGLFLKTLAVTCIGRAESLEDSQKSAFQELFLQRHPELTSLVQSSDCALIKIIVENYYILRQFDQMEELKMGIA